MSDKYQKAIDTSKTDQVDDAGLLYQKEMPQNIQSLISNFYFLKQYNPVFYQLASAAEQFFTTDPNTSMVKLR